MKLKVRTRCFLLITMILGLTSVGYAQNITGHIYSTDGAPLNGASVIIKNSSVGTTSDENGKYSISASPNDVLTFSSVGFSEQSVTVGDRKVIDIVLESVGGGLDAVVVVGYGTQKKSDLTGSVSSISGSTLAQRPTPNSTNLLQGRITGLQVTQPSAEPGRDNPNILIRGRGSFGGSTAPLVLIDGVAGAMNNLSPEDIENVTVLKDAASASIYGARAANGVILVTTKKGRKGETVINYHLNVGRQTAINLPKLITNSATYMEMYNEAAVRSGLNPSTYYPQAEIDKYRNATDRNAFPNFDAIDYYFKPAYFHDHNLSISGGGDKSTFNVSLSYLDQNTFLSGYNFKRYNVLVNYDYKVNKRISIGTSFNLTYKDREEPPMTSQFMALSVYATGPLYGPYLPDGSGRVASKAYSFEGRNRNVSEYVAMGHQYTKDYDLNAQAYLNVDLFKGLTWSSKVQTS